jgi:CDP-diacylglycerol--glycerol-3-phosphate 3-phosphatidyltransferase
MTPTPSAPSALSEGTSIDGDASPSASYESLFRSLARHSRVFPLRSADVALLPTPSAFYDALERNIREAKTRVVLSSLYLGTGELETRLVTAIGDALRENPALQVTVVLDHSRGQRRSAGSSSVAMLAPLLREFPRNFSLHLYKVPQLTGLRAQLPPPFNETMGVLHAKVYLADDTLVLSGANLSEDYFTNRQDRYVQLTRCGALADFYDQFVHVVAAYSFRVNLLESSVVVSSGGTSCMSAGDASDSDVQYELQRAEPSSDVDAGKEAMRKALEALVDNARATKEEEDASIDTWAFPTIQFTPIDVTHDEQVLSEFIADLPAGSRLQIASGYLNFPPFLEDLLVKSRAHLDVLLSAPVANGFFNANGVKGALPMAYSLIEQEFYERTRGRGFEAVLREFNRPKWTFHAKGMWWSPPSASVATSPDKSDISSPAEASEASQTLPQLTIFGSSNFGRRSYGCDLESQVMLFTRSSVLQRRLRDEYDALIKNAETVSEQLWTRPERTLSGLFNWKSGHWIRPVAKFISAYL